MTRGMWPSVYFGTSNRSIRERFRSLSVNKVSQQLDQEHGSARQKHQRQPWTTVLVERGSVVVNHRDTFYFRRGGRDSNSGCSRYWYHRGHSDTIFDGHLHRLQAPETRRAEEKEAQTENATDLSDKKKSQG